MIFSYFLFFCSITLRWFNEIYYLCDVCVHPCAHARQKENNFYKSHKTNDYESISH